MRNGTNKKEKKGAGHGWLTILSELPVVADWYDKPLSAAKR
jgi:hypothetical protein